MDIKQLEEAVRNFNPPDYGRVDRDGRAYVATERFVHRGIKICLFLYRKLERLDQTARLLRDTIDFLLRRYHGYAIEGRIKAHYRDASLKPTDKSDFEHVIPAAVLCALLIQGRISIEFAMNPPTCLIRKKDHKLLKKYGYEKRTPDIFWFWLRYKDLNIKIVTHDGTVVDQATWNLGTHYQYFKLLK